jgi:4,5-dihydroxyphthalate decarboxylase
LGPSGRTDEAFGLAAAIWLPAAAPTRPSASRPLLVIIIVWSGVKLWGHRANRPALVPAPRPPEKMSARKNLELTLAINDYDHTRDLVSGAVPVEGVDLTCLRYPIEEIFFRFTLLREWHVSELSLAKYASLRARDDESVIAIPVFPSRCFRQSAIFVRDDGPIDDPAALAGGRIGVPEWTQTATVYARGLLSETHDIDLHEVEWVQGGTNEPGRIEGVSITLPDGFRLRREADRSLNEMLVAGDLDAMIAAHPPADFSNGSGRIVRLFSDYRAVEEQYFRETGVFPIMHVIVLRTDVHEAHPWVAMNLMTAFEEAKRRSLERALDANTPRFPVPWGFAHAESVQATMGRDLWPYGIEPNRTTLTKFLEFAADQGVCARSLEPEELFAPQVQYVYRV